MVVARELVVTCNDVGARLDVSLLLVSCVCLCSVTARDVGMCIGCLCLTATETGKRAVGYLHRPIRAVDPSKVSTAIQLVPHQHHKYCDRRVRVSATTVSWDVYRPLNRGYLCCCCCCC